MKTMKFFVSVLAVAMAFGVQAQKAAQVTAYNYMKDGELIKAYEEITKAEKNEKTGSDAKTYYYKGQILMGMAASPDVEKRTYVEDPLQAGVDAWKKCLKLDVKDKYSTDIKRSIPQMENMIVNQGVEMYNKEAFEQAYEAFKTANVLAGVLDQKDSLAIFNAAISAEKAGMKKEAIDMFQMSAEINYQAEESITAMARLYKELGDDAKAQETLKMGREMFPNNQAMIIDELNFYLAAEKFDEAAKNLELALQNDANNEILYFALGVAYENLGNIDKATTAYNKALELKPDYFDPAYNLGAMVYNIGVELNNEANGLDYRTKGKQIDALNAKANEKFKEAVKLLEVAHEIDPEDKNTISSLTQIYVRLGMNEKYKEMKAKL